MSCATTPRTRRRNAIAPKAGSETTATFRLLLASATTGCRSMASGRSVTHTAKSQPRCRLCSVARFIISKCCMSLGGNRSRCTSTLHWRSGNCSASSPGSSCSRCCATFSGVATGSATTPITTSRPGVCVWLCCVVTGPLLPLLNVGRRGYVEVVCVHNTTPHTSGLPLHPVGVPASAHRHLSAVPPGPDRSRDRADRGHQPHDVEFSPRPSEVVR